MRIVVIALAALALSGCSSIAGMSGIIGGGKPTTINCQGKGMMTVGPYSINANCEGDKPFKLEVNIQ